MERGARNVWLMANICMVWESVDDSGKSKPRTAAIKDARMISPFQQFGALSHRRLVCVYTYLFAAIYSIKRRNWKILVPLP